MDGMKLLVFFFSFFGGICYGDLGLGIYYREERGRCK